MGARRWWVLSALILALLPFAVDLAMVLPALPHLAASRERAALLAAAYPLTLAVVLPVTVKTAGVRRLLLAGLAAALVGTLIEALADTAGALLSGRVLVGIGAALALPGALRTVQAAFDPAEHVRAIAIWAGFSGLAVALAPWLGGGLVDGHSTAAVFAVQAPFLAVGLAALAAILPSLPLAPGQWSRGSLDLAGPAAVLALVATAAALSFRLQPDWSATSAGLLMIVPVTAFSLAARFGSSRLGLVAVAASAVGLAFSGDDAGLVLLVPLGVGAAFAVSAAPGTAIARLLAAALGLATAALAPSSALLTVAAVSVLALASDLQRRRRAERQHAAAAAN